VGRWVCRRWAVRVWVMEAGGAEGMVRRAVRLICAGWLPHDRVCVGSGPLV
jgi:hypothetical protein